MVRISYCVCSFIANLPYLNFAHGNKDRQKTYGQKSNAYTRLFMGRSNDSCCLKFRARRIIRRANSSMMRLSRFSLADAIVGKHTLFPKPKVIRLLSIRLNRNYGVVQAFARRQSTEQHDKQLIPTINETLVMYYNNSIKVRYRKTPYS